MVALSEGLSLLMRRLSLRKSLKLVDEEVKIEKSLPTLNGNFASVILRHLQFNLQAVWFKTDAILRL